MDKTFTRYPVDEYLKQGISAVKMIDILRQHDCLHFPQLQSGLFPAAIFDNPEQDETGMANAWLRDSACIGLVLLKTDQKDAAIKAVKGVLSCLHDIRQSFESVIAMGHAPESDSDRPPIRFVGQDSKPQYDWANSQNDALGYCLQFIGEAVKNRNLELGSDDRELIDTIVSYLETVQYWNDADSGHWEELKKVSASSIGTVVGGLRSIREIASYETKVVALIEKGNEVLVAILPHESVTLGSERASDAALIFLAEPQHVVSEEMATQIIADAEQNLMGEYGFKRYQGDSYWAPDYRTHFQIGVRTADFNDPKEMAIRDSYLTPGNEAQWTLFDPMVSAYYSRQYQKTGNADDAQKAGHFMVRSLRSIISCHKVGTEDIVWRIPELYFLENNEWVPNDHYGLLWAQANLLHGLTTYQDVFGDAPIRVE